MSYGPNASQEYLKNAVMTASPEQLHLMLYDGAIRFATRGREAIEAKDREAAFNSLDRAQRIVLEMTAGINRDINPELADRMVSLYNFIYRRLVDANLEQDTGAVDDALRILRYQRETWVMLMKKAQEENPQPLPPQPHGHVAVQPPPAGPVQPAQKDTDGDEPPTSFNAEG